MLIIIQTVIAVIVVYFAFSMIVSIICEWIAGMLHLRGKTLQRAILNMFEKTSYKDFGEELLRHPQIENLRNKMDKAPSYIPANNVAVALIDLVKNRAGQQEQALKLNSERNNISQETQVYEQFKAGLKQLDGVSGEAGIAKKTTTVQKSFLSSLAEQTTDLKSLTAAIEKWYNDYMDRVTGWYKRNIKLVLFLIGAAITVAFNVDTIYIVKVAASDPKVRERLNTLADNWVKDSVMNNLVQEKGDQSYFEDYVNDESFEGKTTAEQNVIRDSLAAEVVKRDEEELRHLTQLVYQSDLPVGWDIKKDHSIWITILGWLITAVALSAGAPFWFDMLKRLVNIRNAGIKPDTSKTNN